MFKKISNILLFAVLGAALVLAVVKAQPSKGVSVSGNTAQTGVKAQEPAATATTTGPTTVTTAPTTAAAQASNASPSSGDKAPAASKTAAVASKSLRQVFDDKDIDPEDAVISIFVDKSDHTLSVLADGAVMKSYHVELGEGGSGDKKVSGDHKTPEGTFYITERSVLSPADYYLGTRWMELSYPNKEDAERGLTAGLISRKTYDSIVSAINRGVMPPQNTALGGGVGIHGGSVPSFGSDWTWGCVGLKSKDVEDFYGYMHVGTKVVIRK